nr:hypothetical protein CFP56_42852 [Quercus suber]
MTVDCDDESVDEALVGVLGGENVYSVVVVKGESEEVKGAVGKYRRGWVVWRVSEVEAAERVAEMFVKVFVNGQKMFVGGLLVIGGFLILVCWRGGGDFAMDFEF